MILNKKFFISLLAVLLIVCTVSGTVAFLADSSDAVVNTFEPGTVDVKIEEEFDGDEKSNITVKNIGNASGYFRVKLVSYWYNDTNDTIIAKDSWLDGTTLKNADGTLTTLTPVNGWVYGSDGYFYYTTPITPGNSSQSLFGTVAIPLIQAEDGTRQVLEVLAEAIQSEPDSTVKDVWSSGVSDVTLVDGVKTLSIKQGG